MHAVRLNSIQNFVSYLTEDNRRVPMTKISLLMLFVEINTLMK